MNLKPCPGGRCMIWAMHHNWLLAVIVSNSEEFWRVMTAYQNKYPQINVRVL